MGTAEMVEIADVMYEILSNTTADTIETGPNAGQKSKAKATTDQVVLENARVRVSNLLARFPLYPEIDTETLKKIC